MDSFTNNQRAQVLTEALPYIRQYNGKIVVVKYGGNAMVSEQLRQQVMEDVVLLWLVGVKVVLVHGGGPEISDMMKRLGKKPEFVDGLRVTDAETVDIVQMVLAGKVNKTLVKLLEVKGGRAMGISGMDGGLIQAKMRNPDLGYVGSITGINIEPIMDLLEKGYIPGALGAERLIMMTDIAGVLRDKDDPGTLIPALSIGEAVQLFEENVIAGGMIPKVECCIDAIHRGVQRVIIMDGRVPHSILMEILTDEGAGTMVYGEETEQ